MSTRAELKEKAKEQIKGNIGILFLCGLVVFAISLVSVVPFIGSIAVFVCAPAFMLSIIMIYLALTQGTRPMVADVFKGFNMLGKALWLYIIISFFLFLWSLPALIPMFVMIGKMIYNIAWLAMSDADIITPTFMSFDYVNPGVLWDNISLIYIFGIMLLTFVLAVPAYIKMFSYSMAYYVLAENPTFKAREALNESKLIMKGQKMRLFVLYLSFVLWGLLGIITLGIAYIYVFPYIEATVANFYLDIKRKPETERIEAGEFLAAGEPV